MDDGQGNRGLREADVSSSEDEEGSAFIHPEDATALYEEYELVGGGSDNDFASAGEGGEPDDEDLMGDMDEDGNEDGIEVETGPPPVDVSITCAFPHERHPVYIVATHPSNPELIATGGGNDAASLFVLRRSGQQTTEADRRTFAVPFFSDSVSAAQFSNDGQFAAFADMNGSIMVADTASAQPWAILDGMQMAVEVMQWHPKGNVLLAAGDEGVLWMWKVEEKTPGTSADTGDDALDIANVTESERYERIKANCRQKGKWMQCFAGHQDVVRCGTFTPDGKLIVSGSDDASVKIWNPRNPAPLLSISAASDARFSASPILSLDVDRQSRVILIGAEEGSICLCHVETGKLLSKVGSHQGSSVESVQFSPVVPSLAASGGMDRKVKIWDIEGSRLRCEFGHDDGVTKVQWLKSAPLLVSCSVDRTVRLWDPRAGQHVATYTGHTDAILGMSLLCDDSGVVTCSDDGSVRMFSFRS